MDGIREIPLFSAVCRLLHLLVNRLAPLDIALARPRGRTDCLVVIVGGVRYSKQPERQGRKEVPMHIGKSARTAGFRPHLLGIFAASVASLLSLNSRALSAEPQSATTVSNALAAKVDLGALPPEWSRDSNVMDPIWEPLHLKGVNYYAFGGAQAPNRFAARSDPGSPLYQAWFGAYAIQGGREIFSSNDQSKQFAWLAQLAEFDQKSWLGAMGDPQPEAKWTWHSAPKFETIDGAPRILYHATMKSHSDISAPGPDSTPLAKMLGMPGTNSLAVPVKPFHPIMLKGLYSFWYDAGRDMTFVVYAVSSSFKGSDGTIHDNGPLLQHQLQRMIREVRVVNSNE